jgi:hypothetical protein
MDTRKVLITSISCPRARAAALVHRTRLARHLEPVAVLDRMQFEAYPQRACPPEGFDPIGVQHARARAGVDLGLDYADVEFGQAHPFAPADSQSLFLGASLLHRAGRVRGSLVVLGPRGAAANLGLGLELTLLQPRPANLI